MANNEQSLLSVAKSLSKGYGEHRRPGISVTLKDGNPADRLRVGRHRCECQARIHRLVRNCLSCGRVVCEQEGSGPCLFCGQLVCTAEQRQVLERKSKKSVELYNKLMGVSEKNVKSGEAFTLSTVGMALRKAEEYKNKLLKADAESDMKTQVTDLESDYHNMENNIYLSKEEREAILARKEELKRLRAQQRKAIIVDFDLRNIKVTEAEKEYEDGSKDPVILSIIESSRKKQQISTPNISSKNLSRVFIPKYDERLGRRFRKTDHNDSDDDMDEEALSMLNDEMLYREVASKGFAIGLAQPFATLLVYGLKKHILWQEDLDIRGPILISSRSKGTSTAEAQQCIEHYRKQTAEIRNQQQFPTEYPNGAIVGRALLVDCLPMVEYKEQFPNGDCTTHSNDDAYVLIFDVFEPLLVPIPHLPPSDGVYRIEKQLLTIINQILFLY